METDFMWKVSSSLSEMRLLTEGAIALFEEEAADAFTLAEANHKYEAAKAMDTIGTALYALRERVCTLQVAQIQEDLRQEKKI